MVRVRMRICILLTATQFWPSALAQFDLFCVNGKQLPQLFLLGSQKCGTSSLATQLNNEWKLAFSKNGNLGNGLGKEVHYFDKGGTELGRFADRFPNCGPNTLTMDGTPNYVLACAQMPAPF